MRSIIVVLLLACPTAAQSLPNTKPLTDEGDLAAKMVDGIHKYLDRETTASVEKRKQLWNYDFSSSEAYGKSVQPNRDRLKKLLGVVEQRLAPRMEYVSGPGEPSLVAETEKYSVHAVRWAVFPGVDGEGLLIEPKGTAIANVVAMPDAEQTPEQIVGLAPGLSKEAQFARRLADHGCRVVVPVLIDRKSEWSASQRLKRATNQPHREFVHRMAYEMGRTLAGYEIQKTLAAVDWLAQQRVPSKVGVFGYGEAGRIALFAAALDERIKAVVVSGPFGPRESLADEPIDHNIWGLLTEFGDGELVRLVFPRSVIVEATPFSIAEPPAARPGRSGAAPGRFESAAVPRVVAEMNRAMEPLDKYSFPRDGSHFYFGATGKGNRGDGKADEIFRGPGLKSTCSSFLEFVSGGAIPIVDAVEAPPDHRKSFDPTARQKRQFDQLVAYTQKLWRDSEPVRKALFARADASSPEAWDKSVEPLREQFHAEVIGKLPEPTIPLNPRTRQVYDEKAWTGHEVMLDVYPDVYAYGILLLPKDLKPGEKRPVVVCQHGLEGTPRKTIDYEKDNRPYNHFSRRLVEKGYIVYAPQNPYFGENVFRQLNRKANPLKLSMFSFIIRQHQRTLDWLETLPNVDPKRIGFYGLSYGGKTAMRVPALEKRYCLSICSGDFNEWIGKIVSVDLDRSYMWTREYEMYEFDLGHTFNYAEMAALIAPRPFMVERGHDDGVGTDEMVAYEFAKVRYLYERRLGLKDRAEIEFFNGVHENHCVGTFAFLDRYLK